MSSKANSVDSFSGNDGVDSKIMAPKNVIDVFMEHGFLVDGEDMKVVDIVMTTCQVAGFTHFYATWLELELKMMLKFVRVLVMR